MGQTSQLPFQRTRFLTLPEPLLGFVRGEGEGALLCLFNLSPVALSVTVAGVAAPVGPSLHAVLEGERLVLGPNAAAFLPVLAGQCGNLGAQSLAVTIRGMTLGELRGMSMSRLIFKEGWLGLLNGVITGALAGADRGTSAQVGQAEGGLSVAAVHGAEQREQCRVLLNRQ